MTLGIPCWSKITSKFQDKYGFVFYIEIQDDHPKWQEKQFFTEKLPVDCADTLYYCVNISNPMDIC